MSLLRFGILINCIDGRVQLPPVQWLKGTYHLDYVDVITEPGADKALLDGSPETVARIKAIVTFSVNSHHSNLVALAAHHDCAGNPVAKEEHWAQVRASLQVIRFWNLPVSVVGLWINEDHQVEVIA